MQKFKFFGKINTKSCYIFTFTGHYTVHNSRSKKNQGYDTYYTKCVNYNNRLQNPINDEATNE